MFQVKGTPPRGSGQGPAHHSPLLSAFLASLDECGAAFKQERTARRASQVVLGLLLVTGRKTCMASRHYRNLTGDESADYKIFSRSEWDIRVWYRVVLKGGLGFLPPTAPLVVALDDTGLKKWGKDIPQARYIHDPMSLKWLKQRFGWGIRILHFAAILPFDYSAGRPYAVSIGFFPKPAARKPRGRSWSEEELAQYQAAKKEMLLTTQARAEMEWLRAEVDRQGQRDRKICVVVDGSYMNGPVAKRPIRDLEMVGRVRSTIRLRARYLGPCTRTFYGDVLPTPDEYRTQKSMRWQTTTAYFGGVPRTVKFKTVAPVYWKDGTGKRAMRLIIIAGNPYKPRGKKHRRTKKEKAQYFREPGYLLSTDLTSDPRSLIQHYVDRWQIEDTHRALKSGVGVAHPQVRNFNAVERVSPALVAAYSLLVLAVLKVHGPNWDSETVPQSSASRRKTLKRKAEGKSTARRFSKRDVTMLLRNEIERLGIFSCSSAPMDAPKGWVLTPRETFLDR